MMPRLLSLLRWRIPLWATLPLVIGTLASGWVVGFMFEELADKPAACPETRAECREFQVFWQAWQLARTRFVDAERVDVATLTEGAINGMLASLGDDEHTRYLNPAAAQRWDESLSGQFEGLGLGLERDNRRLLVSSLAEEGPAALAGVQIGDELVTIDERPASEFSDEELRGVLRGPAGVVVQLGLVRAGQRLTIAVTRAEIVVTTARWVMLADNVALVRISSFSRGTGRETAQALAAAREAGAEAFILDLRDNPGGYINEMVTVAGQFLPPGTLVMLEENRDGRRRATHSQGVGSAVDLPLIVLINERSASAAEILAGAVQDSERGRLLGTTTAGTGTVLSNYRLQDGARLLLGTERWLTPSGRSIWRVGIGPDTVVSQPLGVGLLMLGDAIGMDAEALADRGDQQLATAYRLLGEERAAREP